MKFWIMVTSNDLYMDPNNHIIYRTPVLLRYIDFWGNIAIVEKDILCKVILKILSSYHILKYTLITQVIFAG